MSKRWAVGALAGVVSLGSVWAWAQPGDVSPTRGELQPSTMTDEQKTSYALGYTIRQRLDRQGVALDEAALIAGLRSYSGDQPPVMTPQEMAEHLSRHLGNRGAERGGDRDGAERGEGRREARDTGRRQQQDGQRQQPRDAVETGGLPPGYGLNLRGDDRVQSPRLDTAVPETRANTARDDADN